MIPATIPMMSEYRAWVTVPGLPFGAEDRWEPVIEKLERDAPDLGPVIGWTGDVAHFVVSADVDDPAELAERAVSAISRALRAAGHGDLYPAAFEVEAAEDEQLVAACG